MATGITAQWYVRTDGSDSNGGGFDSGLAGAGTNYGDQAAAQASPTDLSCTAASTTVTSASSPFTAQMVGNSIAIGGTGMQVDIYWITGFTNANTITVDRTPSSGGAAGTGTGKVGGALLTLKCMSNGGTAAANPNTTKLQLVGGNVVNIRGAGTNDPSVFDYDFSGGYWTFPNGSTTNGPIRFIGYNGRPYIKHGGLLFYSGSGIGWVLKNLKFVQTVSSFTNFGAAYNTSFVINCIFDQNGFDATQLTVQGASTASNGACFCEFRNSGSTAVGTQPTVIVGSFFDHFYNNWIHDCRFHGINLTGPANVHHNIVNSCKGDGINISGSAGTYGTGIEYNTIDKNSGHGINFTLANTLVFVQSCRGNLISNHTTAAKYGIIANFGSAAANTSLPTGVFDFNAFYNNTIGNYNGLTTNIAPTFIGANDVSLVNDPYTNEATADLSLNNTAGGGASVRNVAQKVGTLT